MIGCFSFVVKEEYIMKTLVRTTIAGREYWDNVNKRTILVAKGSEPNFEVTENPETMLADGNIKEVVSEPKQLEQALPITDEEDILSELEFEREDISVPELDGMKVSELKDFAKEHNIEIPNAIRSKADITDFIKDKL